MNLERRHIRLEGGSNVRDIGGYAGAGGRTVRWGKVYRSAALWRLTRQDWAWINREGIATICDLRSREEREIAPTAWQGTNVLRQADVAYEADRLFGGQRDPDAGINEMEQHFYLKFARLLAPSLKLFFHAMLEEHVPLIIHCAAGQDRTGLAVALLLIALEVDNATILADYNLSTTLRQVDNEVDRTQLEHLAETNLVARFYTEKLRRRGVDAFAPRPLFDRAGEPLLSIGLGSIAREWGSIDAYMEQELGVGPIEVARLRDLLLEPAA